MATGNGNDRVPPGNARSVGFWKNLGDGELGAMVRATYGDSSGMSIPYSIVAGDLDGDGVADLAGSGGPTSGKPVLLVGRHDGTFEPSVSMPGLTVQEPVGHIVDLNGDGTNDIVWGGGRSSTDAWFNGGRAQFAGSTQVGDDDSYGVAVGDVDGNGRLDLVMADEFHITSRVNLGGGRWSDAVESRGESGGSSVTSGVGVADFDGDGRLDAAVLLDGDYDSHVGVARGLGDGRFEAPVFTERGRGAAMKLVVADLNHDTRPDIAVLHWTGIVIRMNDGSGALMAPVFVPLEQARDLVAADLGGDGLLHLVAVVEEYSGRSTGAVHVFSPTCS